MIHLDINPIKCFIRSNFIHKEDNPFSSCKAEIFSIGVYPGHYPTFNVMIEGKYFYNYVPANVLNIKEDFPKTSSLEELSYQNCIAGEAVLNEIAYLKNKQVSMFNREKKFSGYGVYHSNIDWYNDNDSLNLIIGNNGQFYFRPNYRIVFGDSQELPKLNKIREEYKWKL